jgi:MFS transporter, YNFM family, putative membrane transport protein
MTSAPATDLDRAGLLALCMAAFVSMASMRLCDPLLPAFAQAFSVSTGEASRAVSAFAIAYGLLQLVFGPLGDRYGKFRVIALAVLACTLGNLLAALSGDLDMLLLARALSGATAGGIIPLSLAWVGDAVGYERRQETLSRLMVATLLGTAFGQWFSGVLADTVGWRWAFVSLAVLFAVTGAGMLRMSATRGPVAGEVPGHFLHNMLRVLALPWARWILLMVAVEGAFAFAAFAFIPAYLHDTFGLPLNRAAAIAALFAVGGLVYAMQARRMIARFGEFGLALGGALLLGACVMLMAGMRTWMPALAAALLAGLGFTMLHATLQAHATQMAPAARGTATALFGASLFLGQSLGILVAGFAVDAFGFRAVLAAAGAVIVLLGAVFGSSLRRHARLHLDGPG